MDAIVFRVNLTGLTSSDFDYIRAAALITFFVKCAAYTWTALIPVNKVCFLLFLSSNRLLYFQCLHIPHVRKSRFRNSSNVYLLNPGSWALESRIMGLGIQDHGPWNPESWALGSRIPLKIEIQNPSSTDKESGIQNVESRKGVVGRGGGMGISFSMQRK